MKPCPLCTQLKVENAQLAARVGDLTGEVIRERENAATQASLSEITRKYLEKAEEREKRWMALVVDYRTAYEQVTKKGRHK